MPHDVTPPGGEALSLYHEVHGAGPPLVLLHGALGTIRSCFSQLLPRLAATRQVIAVELQGHGHTPDTDRPLTYRGMADDVADLLSHLGRGPVDIVGYSMGGGVGIDMAIRYPALVRRVVFAGGPAFRPDGLHPELIEATSSQRTGDAGIEQLEELADSLWQRAYLEVAPDPGSWATLVAKVNALDRSFTGWAPDEVRSITAPVMLVAGDADIVRPGHVVEMFELLGGGRPGDLVPLPEARLAVLPGTTHVGLLDRVAWLHPMITEFLDPPAP